MENVKVLIFMSDLCGLKIVKSVKNKNFACLIPKIYKMFKGRGADLGPISVKKFFLSKSDSLGVICAGNRLRAFPKHGNASLTLIQGIGWVYWSENRKKFDFPPENRLYRGFSRRGIDCAYLKMLRALYSVHPPSSLNQDQGSFFIVREHVQSISCLEKSRDSRFSYEN